MTTAAVGESGYGFSMALDEIAVGAVVRRTDVAKWYGGGIQGGIIPSNISSTVMIYTDPAVGEGHGYKFDGWADGAFFYTGAGQEGDQVLTRVNGAILGHRAAGRSLHVFEAMPGQGLKPAGGKLQRYCGEFALDDQNPYRREEAPDRNGDMRSVVVFKLVPIGHVIDTMNAGRADEPTSGVEVIREPVESNEIKSFERRGTMSHTAHRREAELMARLESHLDGLGREVCRLRIKLPDSSTELLTDTFDVSRGDLYEVKASSTRENMRMAVGQLIDYARYVPEVKARLVVMPVEPTADLIDLAHAAGIAVVWPEGAGFTVAEPEDHE